MGISTIGIDIGKNSFHFVALDARGAIVVRRQCSRTQLIRALANLRPCLVGMSAVIITRSLTAWDVAHESRGQGTSERGRRRAREQISAKAWAVLQRNTHYDGRLLANA